MRRTPTTPARAKRSADARLEANSRALQQAYADDVRAGNGSRRYQWRAATEWLRSEVTALPEEDSQLLLDHIIQVCRDANAQARRTVVPADHDR
jgi:hypothetical protein